MQSLLFLKAVVAVFLLISAPLSFAQKAPGDPQQDTSSREFIMSCTYGVMAGTLVGAASLAFTSKPSENLNRVARGASLGLYTGILLGFYAVYIVPSMESSPEEEPVVRLNKLNFMISPTLAADNRTPDGLKAEWKFYRF